MAWVRTFVVLAGTWGLVSFHMFHDHSWVIAAAISAAIAGLILVTCGWVAAARGRQARMAMDSGSPVAAPAPLLLLTITCVAAATIAFASTAHIG